jgi:hypothetical protein
VTEDHDVRLFARTVHRVELLDGAKGVVGAIAHS